MPKFMNHYHHKKHDDSQQNSKKNIHILFVRVFNFEWNMFFLPSLHYMLFITGTKINRRAVRKRCVQFFNIIFRDKIFAICIKMIAHHSGKCIHKHLKRLAIIRILRRFFWLCSILKVLNYFFGKCGRSQRVVLISRQMNPYIRNSCDRI